jgi:hypothetical protein
MGSSFEPLIEPVHTLSQIRQTFVIDQSEDWYRTQPTANHITRNGKDRKADITTNTRCKIWITKRNLQAKIAVGKPKGPANSTAERNH